MKYCFGAALLLFVAWHVPAQTNAFTYQGRLAAGGLPANGAYDLSFALYDSASGGNQQGTAITNNAVAVTNGLFTVTLDFGNQFPGEDRWLEIGVRTNGGGAFATLSPRQALTATPYAVRAANAGTAATADSVAAANITGTIPLARLPSALVTNGASGVSISGSFSGDGTGLTRLNTDALWRSRAPVVAWGLNGSHQTDIPPGLTNVKAVSAGIAHSLALKTDGTVVAWGAGMTATGYLNFGQSVVPADLSSVASVAAGWAFSVALRSNGTVVAWGRNIDSETNVPPSLNNVVAIAAGSIRSLALKNDGTVVGWGTTFGFKPPDPEPPLVPPGLSNVVAIAAGSSHCLALHSDGTVVAWGIGDVGQTDVPSGVSNVVAIAAGNSHNLALRNDGTVVAWGWNDSGQTNVPAGLTNVVAIAAGGIFSLALKSDGTVVAWGDNQVGQATAPAGLSDVIALAAGGAHSLALRTQEGPAAIAFLNQSNVFQGPITATSFAGDGSGITSLNVESLRQPVGAVIEWTSPFDVTIPQGLRNVVAISAGSRHDLALESDGTVDAWGDNFNGQCNVPPGLNNVVAIAAGDRHSLALKSDGKVVAWGGNIYGETDVPPDLDGVIAIGAGHSFSLALRNDGTIRGWGLDCYNQDAFTGGVSNIVAIAAGFVHSLVLRSDGIVFGLGSTNLGTNNFSQNFPPAGLSNVVAIAGGGEHSLALKSDGTVVAWGGNRFGETDVPAGLSDVTAIATGTGNSLALKSDGTVIEWGSTVTPELIPKAVIIAAGGNRSLIVVKQMIPAQVALLSENAKFSGLVSAAAISSSGNISISGTNTLDFGAGVPDRAADAGKIGYQTLSADALDIVGAGTNASNRKVHIFSEGGTTIDGDLTVNGNIGIGTATPATRLTVATPANSYGIEHTDGTRRLSTYLSSTGGWLGTVSPDPFYLFANDGAPALTIGTNGNVGIGTPFPGKALQVGDAGLPGSEGMIRLSSRTVTGGSATRTWDIGVPQTSDNASGIGYSFVINDVALASSTPQLLVQWGTGNVGIGTTNPAVKLDVNGTVRATQIQAPGILPWQLISGTSQQAQPNTGYLATNDLPVTVTLPANVNLGDIVRVSGPGAGGWRIAQGPSQSVPAGNLSPSIGAVWTVSLGGANWTSVASSADGSKLVAAVQGSLIYTSTNSGSTWTSYGSGHLWQSVASSSDGTRLVAAAYAEGIYTSADSGQTWTKHETNRNWQAVASSADGSKLVAVIYSGKGKIYTSSDSGVTWTARESDRFWHSVASSADGTKLVAVASSDPFGGGIYISTDSGVTWTQQYSLGPYVYWFSVASSSDGTRLVAVVQGGQIYTSTDSGLTWSPRDSTRAWSSVCSSSDGTRLVATVSSGQIYTSTDSGLTWSPRESSRAWYSVASSSDGTKLVAAVSNGAIYTSVPTTVSSTTAGETGYLLGGQNTAIELQYVGSGKFLPLSYTGNVSAY